LCIKKKWGLQINFWKTEYLTLNPGSGIVTETGQSKAVNKFKYLVSILEATGATTLEIEKIISEGRRVTGMLNSVLWSKTILLLLLWLHGYFSSALASLTIADHSFLSCALILHLLTPRAFYQPRHHPAISV
jgi:hypothetical protein